MVATAYISARREYDLCDLRKLLIASVLLPNFVRQSFIHFIRHIRASAGVCRFDYIT